jgi:CheY-like chemotaxis protein
MARAYTLRVLARPLVAGRIPRVLVVDDDDTIRYAITETLLDEGYDVVAAADGQEALACVDQHGADLVLLDMQMPVMDGPACFAALRQRTDPPKVITIAAATAGLAAARNLGADAALTKPFDLDEVLALVALLLHDTAARTPTAPARLDWGTAGVLEGPAATQAHAGDRGD